MVIATSTRPSPVSYPSVGYGNLDRTSGGIISREWPILEHRVCGHRHRRDRPTGHWIRESELMPYDLALGQDRA